MKHVRVTSAILSMFALALIGCASQPLDAEKPQPWELKLYRATADHRYTYFEVDRNGMLFFAGGKNANLRMVEPVAQLTEDQQRELWRIIVGEELMEFKQPAPWTAEHWASPRLQQYDLSMTVGRRIQSLRCVDEQPASAGLKRLHDALFEIQSQVRYQQKSPGQLSK